MIILPLLNFRYQTQGCRMSFRLIVFISVLGIQSSSVFASSPKLTAEEIIARVAKTYQKANSYSDTGVVKTLYFEESGKRLSETPFATDFVRKKNFRFEFSYKHPFPFSPTYKNIVLGLGKQAITWRDYKLGEDKIGVNKEKSIDMAIAGATGISGGAAYNIPALLRISGTTDWKNTMLNFPSNTRLADEQWRQKDYFKVEITRPNKNDAVKDEFDKEVLWIDPDTFLIHRIDEATNFGYFSTQTTTIYQPKIEVAIAPERFTVPTIN